MFVAFDRLQGLQRQFQSAGSGLEIKVVFRLLG